MNSDEFQAFHEFTEGKVEEIRAIEVGKSVSLQPLSTDFEVLPSFREVISFIETVALKKVDTTDVKVIL